MSADGFLSRMLGRDTDDEYDDSGAYYSSEEEVESRRSRRSRRSSSSSSSRGVLDEEEPPPREFIVERVAETISDLPEGVPQESAVLIVRRTLAAAGVKLSELDASTQAQESKLNSEIGLARNRQEEVREKTQEQVRSLEKEIRKAKEACEDIVSYEEEKISRAWATLEGVRRVRAFFELHESEGEEDTGPLYRGTQQVLEPADVDRAQISDTPLHPGGRD
jgi:vacuolar-type H+-ATPase subunit I/STV1